MYPRVFFEQEVLHVLAVLNAVEIACFVCGDITTRDFHSSSNRAVPYFSIAMYHLSLSLNFHFSRSIHYKNTTQKNNKQGKSYQSSLLYHKIVLITIMYYQKNIQNIHLKIKTRIFEYQKSLYLCHSPNILLHQSFMLNCGHCHSLSKCI